jgi:uncharacterized membrane protein YhaH (DUF805 family)
MQMSFGNTKIFYIIQQVLILTMMIAALFALFYGDISTIYKVVIVAIVFVIVILMNLAVQILRAYDQIRQQQRRAANYA